MTEPAHLPVPSRAALSSAQKKFDTFLHELPDDERQALAYQIAHAAAAGEVDVQGYESPTYSPVFTSFMNTVNAQSTTQPLPAPTKSGWDLKSGKGA